MAKSLTEADVRAQLEKEKAESLVFAKKAARAAQKRRGLGVKWETAKDLFVNSLLFWDHVGATFLLTLGHDPRDPKAGGTTDGGGLMRVRSGPRKGQIVSSLMNGEDFEFIQLETVRFFGRDGEGGLVLPKIVDFKNRRVPGSDMSIPLPGLNENFTRIFNEHWNSDASQNFALHNQFWMEPVVRKVGTARILWDAVMSTSEAEAGKLVLGPGKDIALMLSEVSRRGGNVQEGASKRVNQDIIGKIINGSMLELIKGGAGVALRKSQEKNLKDVAKHLGGRYLDPGIVWRNKGIHDLLKQVHDSPDALEAGMEHKEIVNLLPRLAWGFFDPVFEGAIHGGKALEFYVQDMRAAAKAQRFVQKSEDMAPFLKYNYEGNSVSNVQGENLFRILREAGPRRYIQSLRGIGLQPRSVLSDTAGWLGFRRAGFDGSPDRLEIEASQAGFVREMNKQLEREIASKPQVEAIIRKLNTHDKATQFAELMASETRQTDLMLKIQQRGSLPYDPEVIEAWQKLLDLREDGDFLVRYAHGKAGKERQVRAAIEQTIGQMLQDPHPEVQKQLKGLFLPKTKQSLPHGVPKREGLVAKIELDNAQAKVAELELKKGRRIQTLQAQIKEDQSRLSAFKDPTKQEENLAIHIRNIGPKPVELQQQIRALEKELTDDPGGLNKKFRKLIERRGEAGTEVSFRQLQRQRADAVAKIKSKIEDLKRKRKAVSDAVSEFKEQEQKLLKAIQRDIQDAKDELKGLRTNNLNFSENGAIAEAKREVDNLKRLGQAFASLTDAEVAQRSAGRAGRLGRALDKQKRHTKLIEDKLQSEREVLKDRVSQTPGTRNPEAEHSARRIKSFETQLAESKDFEQALDVQRKFYEERVFSVPIEEQQRLGIFGSAKAVREGRPTSFKPTAIVPPDVEKAMTPAQLKAETTVVTEVVNGRPIKVRKFKQAVFRKEQEFLVDLETGRRLFFPTVPGYRDYHEEIMRLTRDAPEWTKFPVINFIKEAGEDGVAAANRRRVATSRTWNKPRQVDEQAFSRELFKKTSLPDFQQMLGAELQKMISRARRELNDATVRNTIDMHRERAKYWRDVAPESAFGGDPNGRRKIVSFLERMADELEASYKQSPTLGQKFIDGYDQFNSFTKRAVLFTSGEYYVQNPADNTLKNALDIGLVEFFKYQPRGIRLTGEAIDAATTVSVRQQTVRTGGLLPGQERAVTNIEPVPGVGASVRDVFRSIGKGFMDLSQAAEKKTRDILYDYWYYHPKSIAAVEEQLGLSRGALLGSGKTSGQVLKEADAILNNRAMQKVREVQFDTTDVRGAAAWAERHTPFILFSIENAILYTKQSILNHRPLRAIAQIQKAYDQADGPDFFGKIRAPGSRVSIDVTALSAIHNAARFLDRIPNPFNWPAEDSIKDEAMRKAHRFATNFRLVDPTPRAIKTYVDFLKSGIAVGRGDLSQFPTRAQAGKFARDVEFLPGNLGRWSRLLTGRDPISFAAEASRWTARQAELVGAIDTDPFPFGPEWRQQEENAIQYEARRRAAIHVVEQRNRGLDDGTIQVPSDSELYEQSLTEMAFCGFFEFMGISCGIDTPASRTVDRAIDRKITAETPAEEALVDQELGFFPDRMNRNIGRQRPLLEGIPRMSPGMQELRRRVFSEPNLDNKRRILNGLEPAQQREVSEKMPEIGQHLYELIDKAGSGFRAIYNSVLESGKEAGRSLRKKGEDLRSRVRHEMLMLPITNDGLLASDANAQFIPSSVMSADDTGSAPNEEGVIISSFTDVPSRPVTQANQDAGVDLPKLPAPDSERENRISFFRRLAPDMHAVDLKGIPPHVILPVAMLETGNGTGDIYKRTNNYFSITRGNWGGPTYKSPNNPNRFRIYNSGADSVADFVDLISRSTRYRKAFEAGQKGDAILFYQELQNAGYGGSDKRYASKLSKIYQEEIPRPGKQIPGNDYTTRAGIALQAISNPLDTGLPNSLIQHPKAGQLPSLAQKRTVNRDLLRDIRINDQLPVTGALFASPNRVQNFQAVYGRDFSKEGVFLLEPIPLPGKGMLIINPLLFMPDPKTGRVPDPVVSVKMRELNSMANTAFMRAPEFLVDGDIGSQEAMNIAHGHVPARLGTSMAVHSLMSQKVDLPDGSTKPYFTILMDSVKRGRPAPFTSPDPKKRALDQTRFDSPDGRQDAYNALVNGRIPIALKIRDEKMRDEKNRRERERTANYEGYIKQMRAAVRDPLENVGFNPTKVFGRIERARANGELPLDFWSDVIVARKEAKLVHDFALTLRATNMPWFASQILTRDERGQIRANEVAVNAMYANDFLREDLKLFAHSHDVVANAINAIPGGTLEMDGTAIPNLFAAVGQPLTPETVMASAGIISPDSLPTPEARNRFFEIEDQFIDAEAERRGVPRSQVEQALNRPSVVPRKASADPSDPNLPRSGADIRVQQLPRWTADRKYRQKLVKYYGAAPPERYQTTFDYARGVLGETSRRNRMLAAHIEKELNDSYDPESGVPREAYESFSRARAPRANFFSVAAEHFPSLGTVTPIRDAAFVMNMGQRLGLQTGPAADMLNAAVNQVAFTEQGTRLALAGGLFVAEGAQAVGRFFGLGSGLDAEAQKVLAQTVLNDTAEIYTNGAHVVRGTQAATNPPKGMPQAQASSAVQAQNLQTAGNIGAGLSALGGALSAREDVPDAVSDAVSITGGTISGAVQGAQLSGGNPYGILAGAAIGATLSALGASFGPLGPQDGGRRRPGLSEDERQRIQNARERARLESDAQQRRQSLQARSRLDLRARADEVRRQRTVQRNQRLREFFRRPTFQSAQGLAVQAERQAVRQFRPTF